MDNRRWILAGLSALILAAPVQAQDDSLVQVVTFEVRPGKNAQFEEAVSAFREASKAQGMENYWLSAQSVSGSPIYRFHVEQSGWGDLSNPPPQMVEHFGEEEAARLAGLLADSVVSEHVAFYRELANSSYAPADGFDVPPEGLIYIDFTLNAGTAPMFLEMTEHQKEASMSMYPNNYFGVSMPEFGGAGPRTILILNSFSDLDTPTLAPQQRLIEHFGEAEGGRLIELAAQSIVSFEPQLFRTRPDLNYQPE